MPFLQQMLISRAEDIVNGKMAAVQIMNISCIESRQNVAKCVLKLVPVNTREQLDMHKYKLI